MRNMKYEQIIDLPHHVSATRAQMPCTQRAAQFAPFAALTGLDRMLAEKARHTEGKIELTEGEVAAINDALCRLKENLGKMPMVRLHLFYPDGQKEGGSYRMISGRIVKIDEYRQMLWLDSGEKVEFEQIVKLIEE